MVNGCPETLSRFLWSAFQTPKTSAEVRFYASFATPIESVPYGPWIKSITPALPHCAVVVTASASFAGSEPGWVQLRRRRSIRELSGDLLVSPLDGGRSGAPGPSSPLAQPSASKKKKPYGHTPAFPGWMLGGPALTGACSV